jgi:hypothetical protein
MQNLMNFSGVMLSVIIYDNEEASFINIYFYEFS